MRSFEKEWVARSARTGDFSSKDVSEIYPAAAVRTGCLIAVGAGYTISVSPSLYERIFP